MGKSAKFGEMLTEAIHLLKASEGKTVAIIEDELGYALGRGSGAAVERWRAGHLPPAAADIEKLARLLIQRGRGRLDRPWLAAFLRSAGYPYPEQLGHELFPPENPDAARLHLAAIPPCPYRGLEAFREEDVSLFFGREVFSDRLLEAVRQQPVVALIGPSGSGKSSLLFAGLLPRLRRERHWTVADFRPGDQPFQALAAALVAQLEPQAHEIERLLEAKRLAGALRGGDLTLPEVSQHLWRKRPETRRLLLIIDQLEELYVLSPAEEQSAFLDLLFADSAFQQDRWQSTSGHRMTFLFTLRADFLEQALAHRPLADALQDGSVMLGYMTEPELRQAIENPAHRQQVRFESGLVERILKDVRDMPGRLPLLQFALTVLWQEQIVGAGSAAPTLTHAAYEKIGLVQGNLTRYADNIFENLKVQEREQIERIFLRMISPGVDTADTCRPVQRADLSQDEWGLAQRLASTRLVVTSLNPAGQEIVEVAHQALVWGWSRLRRWLDEDKEFLLWRQRLQAARGQWEVSHHDEGALLRGALLAEAIRWLQERALDLSLVERAFIQESAATHARRQAAREQEYRRLRSRELAGRALEALGGDPRQGLALALEAFNITYAADQTFTAEARAAVNQALLTLFRAELQGHTAAIRSAAFSPDGSRLVTGSEDGTVRLWHGRDGTLIAVLEEARGGGAGHAVFYHQGARLVTAGSDGAIRLWQAQDGAWIATQAAHEGAITALSFNADGTRLLTAGDDGTARLWDARVDEALPHMVLPGHAGPVIAAGFTADGKRAVTADAAGVVRLWQSENGTLIAQLVSQTTSLTRAHFSPDGTRLATVIAEDPVCLWDGRDGSLVATLTGHEGKVTAISFSPDSTLLATAGADHAARLWRSQDGHLMAILEQHRDELRSVAFSPDGRRVATTSNDGTARLWRSANGAPLATLRGAHVNWVLSAIFNDMGTRMVTTGADTAAWLWDAHSGEPIAELAGHERAITISDYNRDGTRLVTADSTGRVRLWNGQDGTLIGHTDWVLWAGFSPDGSRVVTTSADKTARLWDAQSGASMATFRGHQDWVGRGDVSADGGRLVTCSRDGTARLWRLADGALIATLHGHAGFVYQAKFNPAGTRVASVGWGGTARLWDGQDGRHLMTLVGHSDKIYDVAFSPDGERIITASWDSTARLWEVENGSLIAVLAGHADMLEAASFSPDGRVALTASRDGTARIWDGHNGTVIATLEGHTGLLRAARFSPDGKHIITAGADGVARLWDRHNFSLLTTLAGHLGRINSAEFSPDGMLIVTASLDGTARLWQAPDGAPVAVLKGHRDKLWFARFSPDGRRIVTTSFDHTARLWQPFVDVEAMLAEAKRRLGYLPHNNS